MLTIFLTWQKHEQEKKHLTKQAMLEKRKKQTNKKKQAT